MKQPDQVMGVKWGEEAHKTADRLGASCAEWRPWGDQTAFETCLAEPPVHFFGRECSVMLVRADEGLEGLQLLFPAHQGPAAELREAVRAAFELETGDDADFYHGTEDGGLVRLACDPDGACTLTVAGPRFGELYAAQEFERGFGALGASMRP